MSDSTGHFTRYRFVARAGVLLLLVFELTACGDGPTAPGTPPTTRADLLLERTTSWVASEPQSQQTGEFFYDDDRLVRWEFSHNLTGEWRTTMRKEFLYRDDGLQEGHDHFVHLGGSWRLTRTVRYVYDEERGLPIEVRIQELEERTGNVLDSTWELRYDERDRVVEMQKGVETLAFSYDPNGDIVEIRSIGDRPHVLLARLTHSDARNPLGDLPPRHGIPGGIFAPDHFSRHLSDSWENGIEGEPAASRGTATVDIRPDGYPSRRDFTFWNTADPDIRTIAVTEYEYREPSD